VPLDATAVSFNATIVSPSGSSFLTVWPADQPRPTASSLNWVTGQPATPNAATSALSATGLVVDIDCYYTPANSTGAAP
jgi:hypothetical protein